MNLSVSYTIPSAEVRAWFDHSTRVTFSKRLTGSDIIQIICDATGTPKTAFLSKRKDRSLAYVRFAAWRLMRTHTDLSYPQIGKLCNRDHTSIISGVNKAKTLLASEGGDGFREIYQQATNALQEFI